MKKLTIIKNKIKNKNMIYIINMNIINMKITKIMKTIMNKKIDNYFKFYKKNIIKNILQN